MGDRGYCSYNNMAHVMEQGQFFVFRTKDIHSKGLVANFDFPVENSFDINVDVTLVRSHSKNVGPVKGYKRFVDSAGTFDYITYGSLDTYKMSFRILRFAISENTYECIVTNLPANEFPAERIKDLYFSRWGIESSFRKLKYTIGLSNFHAYKPEFIQQEIWAKLIAYNATEVIINHTIIKNTNTKKHVYKVNFSVAVHVCTIFLRLTTEKDSIDVMALLRRELIPIREERQYPRLQSAHFRKPRYFIYRAA
ncbi:MAG: transposase [Anaerocolumna sp.]